MLLLWVWVWGGDAHTKAPPPKSFVRRDRAIVRMALTRAVSPAAAPRGSSTALLRWSPCWWWLWGREGERERGRCLPPPLLLMRAVRVRLAAARRRSPTRARQRSPPSINSPAPQQRLVLRECYGLHLSPVSAQHEHGIWGRSGRHFYCIRVCVYTHPDVCRVVTAKIERSTRAAAPK